MKEFIKKIIVFASFLVLLNVFYYYLLIHFHAGSKKSHDIALLTNSDYDLIALGNSMTLDGFDAKLFTDFGIKSSNFALGGAHVKTSYLILKNYLNKNKNPKYVLVGLSSAVGNSYLNPYEYDSPEYNYFFEYDLAKRIINPPMYHFQWTFLELIKVIMSKDHRNSNLVEGQWQSPKIVADDSKYQFQKNNNILPKNPYLDSIAIICKKNSIELVLVDFPGAMKNRNVLPSKYKIKLAGRSDSVMVHNFNNLKVAQGFIDDKTDWLSANHLNKFGANKFSALILPIFQNH